MRNLFKPLLAVKTKSGYSILTALVVTLFSTWVIFDATKAEVVVAADGEEQIVKTHIRTVGELLEDLGIDVTKHDELSHTENTEIVDGMKISFETASKILLTIDGDTEEYYTVEETVGEFFESEELTFSEHDEISHNNIELIEDGMEITVTKAFQVKVKDGEKVKKLWTTGGTVKEFLKENGIKLGKSDKVKPSLKKDIHEDTKVSIIRVEKKTKEVEEKIPFQTEEKEDSSLKKGVERTISEGKEGLLVKTIEITLENGKEVKSEVISEDVKKEPKNKVTLIGTKEEVNQVVSNSGSQSSNDSKQSSKGKNTNKSNNSNASTSSSSEKVFTMEATAYGPDCAGCSGISATGINLKGKTTPKVVAVDPSVIPLGSRVWVEGYGEAVAGDTGGAIKGNRIDVLFPSEAQASSKWGRRTVKVKVLN